MKERPILFSGPMVRAILDGRKTQTRRVVKPQPRFHADGGPGWYPDGDAKQRKHYGTLDHFRRGMPTDFCPYGVPGDRLWVRETWAVDAPLDEVRREREDLMGSVDFGHGPYFRADPVHENSGLTWRPSIHLPRWACRLTLEVVNVRVERLQDISERDCLAEGIGCATEGTTVAEFGMAKRMYRELWDSINAKRTPWASNPWVWVVEFRKVEPPSEKTRKAKATATTK